MHEHIGKGIMKKNICIQSARPCALAASTLATPDVIPYTFACASKYRNVNMHSCMCICIYIYIPVCKCLFTCEYIYMKATIAGLKGAHPCAIQALRVPGPPYRDVCIVERESTALSSYVCVW